MTEATVLIVDDEPDNLSLMQRVLEGTCHLLFAVSGAKTLEIVSRVKPDLILLDVTMPGMDGYTVCRKLKENPDTAEIPVIFVTARADSEDERHGFELGAVDYITKPVSPPLVEARVRTHLLLKRQSDQLKESITKLQHETELLEHKAEMGLLAGGLAHDINNILGSCMLVEMIPELLEDDHLEKTVVNEYCGMVLDMVATGRDICHGFMSYIHSMGEELKPQPFLPLLQPLEMFVKQYKGEMTRDLPQEDPHIRCKGYQIKRVIINLFTNAWQAVEAQENQKIRLFLSCDEETVTFSIEDNGPGIPGDVLPRVFDERFTTKPTGNGLGLFMVKTIMDEHGGEVSVETAPASGTRVILSFPRCDPTPLQPQ